MPGDDLAFLRAELAFFDAVTGISGALYKVPKEERKAAAVREAKQVRAVCDVYIYHMAHA